MSPYQRKNPVGKTGRRAGSEQSPGENRSAEPISEAVLTGWIAFRPKRWDFAGVFGSREEAETKRQRAGADYQLTFGTADVASSRFEPPDG